MVEYSARVVVGELGGRCVFSGSNAFEYTLQAVRKRMQAHLCALKLDPDEKDHAEVAGEKMTCAVVVNGPVDSPPRPKQTVMPRIFCSI